MATNAVDKVFEILKLTNDGDDLTPEHLYLVETAGNGGLSKSGEAAFEDLYGLATRPEGYKKPWFHGIEHMTINLEGRIYWKDQQIECFLISWAYGDEAKAQAHELAERCKHLESIGVSASCKSVVLDWGEYRNGFLRQKQNEVDHD